MPTSLKTAIRDTLLRELNDKLADKLDEQITELELDLRRETDMDITLERTTQPDLATDDSPLGVFAEAVATAVARAILENVEVPRFDVQFGSSSVRIEAMKLQFVTSEEVEG